MKIKKITLISFLFFATLTSYSQEIKKMSLREAIEIVITNSNEAKLASTKVETSKLELETVKNNQYPTAKISGQYMQLTNANVKSNLGGSGAGIDVSQLVIGQANIALPIFNGFKLQNTISASENLYDAQKFMSSHTKEELAQEVVELFAKLYQSKEMVKLYEENLKSTQQRTRDFSAMVDNGLMARNDLLKAQLLESNIQLYLDTAKKNANVVNYQLATLLNLKRIP